VNKPLKNNNLITKQLNSNIMYSLRKRKAKLALLNSVLKPETNSDSASEKSKGAR